MPISLNPERSRHIIASQGDIENGFQIPTSGLDDPCLSGKSKSTGSKEGSAVWEMNYILGMHQAEIRKQLQQWMTQHENHLQQTLLKFQESLHDSLEMLGKQIPARPLQQVAGHHFVAVESSESCPSGSPQRLSPSAPMPTKSNQLGSLKTLTRSATSPTPLNATQSLESSPQGLPRLLKKSAMLTSKADSKCSEGDSIAMPDASELPGTSKRRHSIDSTSSAMSCGSTNYVSAQEWRRRKFKEQFGSNNSSKSTNTNVHKDYVKPTIPMARWIVNTVTFELLFAILIFVNSVFLGVEVAIVSSAPTEEVPYFFYYLNTIFSVAFLIELILRLLDVGGIRSFLLYSEQRIWNWFDLVVVISSLIEVGFNLVLLGEGDQSVTRIMRIARISRLGRVLRVVRIVRFITQLRVLVISIISTLQTLLWAMFLLLIIIYLFAVLLAQATAEYFSEDRNYIQDLLTDKEERLKHYWGSLQAAMYTLFMSIAGGMSWETAVYALADIHWVWAAFFTCFIAFSSFALVNVMTAVFCQSAIESAQRNVDVKWQTMCADKRKHIETLKSLFKSLEGNAKGTISLKKLRRCWGDEAMQAFLNSMDLEPNDCCTFFAILDKQEKDVSASDFVDGCLRLKGYAKAFDMAVMTYELRHLSEQNLTFMKHMQECMHAILDAVISEHKQS